MNCPYMIGYSTVIRDNPCDCPFSATTRVRPPSHNPRTSLTSNRSSGDASRARACRGPADVPPHNADKQIVFPRRRRGGNRPARFGIEGHVNDLPRSRKAERNGKQRQRVHDENRRRIGLATGPSLQVKRKPSLTGWIGAAATWWFPLSSHTKRKRAFFAANFRIKPLETMR